MNLTSKLPTVGTSIFTRIGRLAHAAGALNLAQGFPNFPVDPALPQLIDTYTRAGKNQYAPDIGVAALREAISQKITGLYGYSPDPETEITVTIGATEGIFSSLQALIHPGDEVLYFAPAYDSYLPGIQLAGGVPVAINLHPPHFKIDWNEVRNKITSRTRMIIINNPHNPSGTILSAEDLMALQSIVTDTNLLILSDEVYQHLVYDDQIHQSVIRYPELYARSIVTMSFGKTFHATGWRIGYVLAPPQLSAELRKIHQFNVFSAYTPVQYALADYLQNPKHYLELPRMMQAKRDRFVMGLRSAPFTLLPCQGTYFVCADFSAYWSGSDLALAEHMIRSHGIAAIPLGEFYPIPQRTGILRFCFAKTEDVLDRAITLLNQIDYASLKHGQLLS